MLTLDRLEEIGKGIGAIVFGGYLGIKWIGDHWEKKGRKEADDDSDPDDDEAAERLREVVKGELAPAIEGIRDDIERLIKNSGTDRQLAARAMQGSADMSEMLTAVLSCTNAAIVIIDWDGKIIEWNDGAVMTFGYARKEVLGRNIDLIIPEDQREAHYKGFERYRRTGEGPLIGFTTAVIALHKSGQQFPATLSLQRWEDGKGDRYFCGVIQTAAPAAPAEKADG